LLARKVKMELKVEHKRKKNNKTNKTPKLERGLNGLFQDSKRLSGAGRVLY